MVAIVVGGVLATLAWGAIAYFGFMFSILTSCEGSPTYGENENWPCQGALAVLVDVLEPIALVVLLAAPVVGGALSFFERRRRPLAVGLMVALGAGVLFFLLLLPQQTTIS